MAATFSFAGGPPQAAEVVGLFTAINKVPIG
jgi:hypothetical protein